MALTNEAKNELYKIMMSSYRLDNQSNILEKPFFVETKDTDFKSHITGFTNLKILKIIAYNKNRKIVVFNHDAGSVFGVFDEYDNFIYKIDKHFTNTTTGENLHNIFDVKINQKTGQIYGLCEVNSKTNFFIFNNVIEQIGIVDEPTLQTELFYSTLFDVETEIVKAGDVTIGNSVFADIRTDPTLIYDFNADDKIEFAYSFIINKKATNKIIFISFVSNLGQVNANEATWNYNEEISLSQGSSDYNLFQNIFNLSVLTGERQVSSTIKSIGSIAISTQKDSGTAGIVPFSISINSANPLAVGRLEWEFPFEAISQSSINAGKNLAEKEFANSSNFFNTLLAKIKSIRDSNPISVDYTTDIIFHYTTDTSNNPLKNQELSIRLNKTTIDKLISSTNVSLTIKPSFSWNKNDPKSVSYEANWFLRNENGIVDSGQLYNGTEILGLYATRYLGLFTYWRDRKESGQRTYAHINSYFNITEKTTITGTRNQTSIASNTTSQILIEKEDGKDDLIYKIVQIENNSYGATKPAFISPEKFYIPIKSRETNQFYIAEFNGEVNKTTQDITRFFNGIGDKNYSDTGTDSFQQDLLNPKSITSVVVNQSIISSTEYSLNNSTITIKGISQNDIIVIEYISSVGVPKKINIGASTSGEDIFITSTDDFNELGTLTKSIVGVGDDSFDSNQPKNVFGFNMFRTQANVDYDKITEAEQAIPNIKMKHPISLRQKDLLFFEGYNEDYSKVVKWLQIYPDSFNPYVYLKYSNANRFFALERLNVNKDGSLTNSRFDREFLDIGSSGSTLVATTIAETSDLNNADNNKVFIYGATNQKLFESDSTISKTQVENLSINLQVSTIVKDSLTGSKEISELSRELALTFSNKDGTNWTNFAIAKVVINYSDYSITEARAREFFSIENNVLKFRISLINESGKTPVNLQLITGSNIVFSEVDLTENVCNENLTEIEFDIVAE